MSIFRRRKPKPLVNELANTLYGIEISIIAAFQRHGHEYEDAIDLASIAMEGWLNYVRESAKS